MRDGAVHRCIVSVIKDIVDDSGGVVLVNVVLNGREWVNQVREVGS